MTVAATPRKAGPYAGNGVTTVFPFAFKVFTKDDVQVIYTAADGVAATLVLNSDYSMLLNSDQDSNPGGTITYPKVTGPLPLPQPLPAGDTLTAIGDLPYAQPTDVTNTGRFLPQVIENALDRATIQIQQLAEIASRTLQAAVGTAVSLIFPAPSSGKFIRWRTDELGLENAEAGTDSMVLQGLLADGADPTHGSFMIGYNPQGTGGVPRTLQDKAQESVSLLDKGADDSGTLPAGLALTNLLADSRGEQSIPAGTYQLAADVTPAARDIRLRTDPTALFTGAGKLRLDNILPFQNDPIFSTDVERKDFGPAFDTYANLFLHARHAKCSTTTAVPAVAYYGTGEAASANGRAFGGNFTGFVTANGGRATGIEVDAGFRNGATTGNAFGITIVSAGAVVCDTALQIQANDALARWGNGINFSFNASVGSGAVVGAAIRLGSNGGAAASCERFLYATSDMSATSAEIELPSFRVEATPVNVANRVSIQGGATGVSTKIKASGTDANVVLEMQSQGTGVIILKCNNIEVFRAASSAGVDSLQAAAGTSAATLSVRGSSANADVQIDGKGTGGGKLRDGGATARVRWDTTGLGFQGVAPIAKPTVTGARAGNAALASLLTQLAAYGLVTDSTTA